MQIFCLESLKLDFTRTIYMLIILMCIIRRKILTFTIKRLKVPARQEDQRNLYRLIVSFFLCNFLQVTKIYPCFTRNSLPNIFFTLSVELATESLALFLGLEFVGITTAAAVNERLTHVMLRIVIIRGDGVLAIARVDRRQADRAPRFFDRQCRRDPSNFRRRNWSLSPALPLTGLPILEAILIALTTAVFELVARIATLIVVELLHEAIAGTDHFRQRARI